MGRPKATSRRARAPHSRHRLCLLAGCERRYRPRHPRSRYCGPACRERARGERRSKSSRQRHARAEQARRRRQRRSARPLRTWTRQSEGAPLLPCQRPGCRRRFRLPSDEPCAALLRPGLPQSGPAGPRAGAEASRAGRRAGAARSSYGVDAPAAAPYRPAP